MKEKLMDGEIINGKELSEKEFGVKLTPQEEKELTEDKRREEADSRDADLEDGWTPGE